MERKLGRSACVAWRALLEVRGYEARPLTVDRRALGLPLRTAERALARLEAAGLLTRETRRRRYGGRWYSTSEARVWGALSEERGVEFAWVPLVTVQWCEAYAGRGGARPRGGSAQVKVVDVATAKWRNRTSFSVSTTSENADLRPQSGGLFTSTKCGVTRTSPNGEVRGAAPAPIYMIDQKGVHRPSLTHPKLTGDAGDLDSEPTEPQQRVRYQWIRHLVLAYNRALQTAVGQRGFLKFPEGEMTFATWSPQGGTTAGVITQPHSGPDPKGTRRAWKHYRWLLQAAFALHDHDIPPQAWAEWTLGRSKRTLHVRRVFAAGQVNDNAVRHFFRKESGYGHGAAATGYAPTRTHLEQMYRMRERSRRARGVNNLLCFPPWYSAMRAEEVRQGVDDPMDRFPRAEKGEP